MYTDRPSSLKETVLSAARRRSRASQFGTEHHRRYDDFWALRDISFEIDEGTTFGMIGHNGSGKSTMLRLISGIYQPTTGTVDVEGRISALLELGAGFHPDLTGRENVYLNASVLGLGRAEIDRVIDDIIEFSGIEEFIDVPVKVYSSGMYVRLGFAVSVHVNPEILLIDEVVAVGDEEFQRKCFEHIYQLRRQGVTIVLVSHSPRTDPDHVRQRCVVRRRTCSLDRVDGRRGCGLPPSCEPGGRPVSWPKAAQPWMTVDRDGGRARCDSVMCRSSTRMATARCSPLRATI
ncbi:MAG: ABC transporter ATP-binding protein [Microthrixaceae bacterium]|nr:ABC transporter ATP-binding protein [Microthrixaceae bacterium]